MELYEIYGYFDFNYISLLIVISLFISTCSFLSQIKNISQWYKLRQKRLPGPVGLPFVGYLPFLGKEPHKTLWEMRNKYGHIFSVYFGPKYTVVLNDYTVTKEVLSHPGTFDRSPEIFKHIENVGFVAENGGRWIEQRKFVMSTAKDLGLGKDYWGILLMKELSKLVKRLQDLKGKPCDISHDLASSLNTSILSLLIGRCLGEDEIDKINICSDFADAAIQNVGVLSPTSLVPGLGKIFEVLKIAGYDKAKKIIRQFQSFIREEIKRHKISPHFQDTPDFINTYLGKLAELSRISNKDHFFSETMLEGNVKLLFLGASDTIISSLTWLLQIICKYKDVQEKVHMELMDVYGMDGLAKYGERDKFPYTFAVLMEAQRYASIVPLSTTRIATQDIPVNGYIIPKGSEITANLWGLHHDPKYWEDPEEFRPERFLTDGGTKINKNPQSYAPFSLGRRNCPGAAIAFTEMLHYFTELLKRFEISTPPGVETKFEVVGGFVTRLAPQPLCFKERNV